MWSPSREALYPVDSYSSNRCRGNCLDNAAMESWFSTHE
jgi:hypothetical protein